MTKHFNTFQTTMLLTGKGLSTEILSSKEGYRMFVHVWGYRKDPAHPFGHRLSSSPHSDHSDARFTLQVFEISQADLDARYDIDDASSDLAYFQDVPDLETLETLLSDYLTDFSVLTSYSF